MARDPAPFAELSALSNFTFLTGASHPEEYMERAALAGLPALAVADVNSVAGIVRAHTEAREIARWVRLRAAAEAKDGPIGPPAPPGLAAPAGSADIACAPRLLAAARIVLRDGFTATALPRDRAAWSRLCRLLSVGRLRAPKGDCDLGFDDLLEWGEGIELLLHPPQQAPLPQAQAAKGGAGEWAQQARRLTRRFPGQVSLMLAPAYDGADLARFDRLAALARDLGLPAVASALPVMHVARRRRMADVLTAIRTGTRVADLGRAAQPHAEQRLRSEPEMLRLFRGHEDAVRRAGEIAARLAFSLDELSYEYPSEVTDGETPARRLRRLAEAGLRDRYPHGVPEKCAAMLEHELTLIGKLKYEPYFLTVHDIVQFARGEGILCQGRGSAANSITCYALGVTSVSPEVGTMVFERFVSEARNEPPDIDVDFEHERREEVIQHIYARYGRHRAGLCATVIHYRGKRAIREVGKAMGLSDDTLAALASQIWGYGGAGSLEETRLREVGLDPADPHLVRTIEIIREIQGFPRHLSQHVGGFIITEGRLDELVPVENATMEDRTVIPWDKDDIDSLKILKVDILALGMLTCLRKAFDLVRRQHGIDLTLDNIPQEDAPTYEMLCKADSLGLFQVESRAQMNFLPRMKPRTFYDLVIQVAIIRPGPIQGDMVHPFIRRRNGQEDVDFPSDALGAVLRRTLGVPLFQEQAMQIAIVGAGFSPEEADRLRRSLATFKKHGSVSEFEHRFMSGMKKNGYDEDFARRCFSQIEGFGSYGFPESHAASFALLAYASAWLKRHHPAIYACALLNAQPMGFYAPAQIVRDVRAHGVEVRPVSINASHWDNVIERGEDGRLALRLGFRQLKAVGEEDGDWIAAARGNGYQTVEDVWRRAGLGPDILTALAEADAFAEAGLPRREAIWAARAIATPEELPLFAGSLEGEGIVEPAVHLRALSANEEVVEDYLSVRLSLRGHPMDFLRPAFTPARWLAIWAEADAARARAEAEQNANRDEAPETVAPTHVPERPRLRLVSAQDLPPANQGAGPLPPASSETWPPDLRTVPGQGKVALAAH